VLALARLEQASRLEDEPWAESIRHELANNITMQYLTSAAIASAIGVPVSQQHGACFKRIAAAMKELGYEAGRESFGAGVGQLRVWGKKK
jgi:hypothetical protein